MARTTSLAHAALRGVFLDDHDRSPLGPSRLAGLWGNVWGPSPAMVQRQSRTAQGMLARREGRQGVLRRECWWGRSLPSRNRDRRASPQRPRPHTGVWSRLEHVEEGLFEASLSEDDFLAKVASISSRLAASDSAHCWLCSPPSSRPAATTALSRPGCLSSYPCRQPVPRRCDR